MNRTVQILEISDLAISGPDPFSSDSGRNSSAMSQGSTITLKPDAAWKVLSLTDGDSLLQDSDSDQETTAPITVNGRSFGTGTDVEVEYSYVLRPIGATDSSQDVTIYAVEFDSDVEAIAASGPLRPGVTYRVLNNAGSESPSVAYSSLYVCFAAGTPIATPQGWRAVEDLCAGDLVATADDGAQPILWAGGRRVVVPAARGPVTILPGALGNDRTVRLSPQHRVLVGQGGAEGLLPVKALVGRPGIIAATQASVVTWHHLALPRHAVLSAGGAWAETLWPGAEALRMLGADAAAVARAVPGFDPATYPPARPLLRPGQWRRGVPRAA